MQSQAPPTVVIDTTVAGVGGSYYFELVPSAFGEFIGSEPTRFYSDPGTTVGVRVRRASPEGSVTAAVTVSGYLAKP